MIPWWCDFIVLKNRGFDDNSGSPCECDADIEYRHGSIIFFPNFLLESEKRQVEYIRHELFHFEVAWIVDWSQATIRKFLDGSPRDQIILDEFRTRTENVIQSLARKYNVKK